MSGRWREIGPVSPVVWAATLKDTPLGPFQEDLYRAAGKYSALALAQIEWESGFGTSDLAKTAQNILGQRPRPDDESGLVTPDWFRVFASPVACVQYWFAKIDDPTYAYANTVTLEDYIHTYSPDSDNHPGQEAEYVAHIRARLQGWGVSDTPGASPMTTYATPIPGLPGGPLITTHPVYTKLIPEWRTNNRPGIAASRPRRSVQHGNANPNSSAAGEATYLFNGAEGRQASYHSSTDDRESWIMLPADEVSWQAADGDGPGNMCGFSNEMVEDAGLWNSPTRRDRVIANAAELMGGVAARLDIAEPEQHFTFNAADPNRHDCPNKLRYTRIDGRLAWDLYAERWRAAKAAELARMTGSAHPPPTKPPPPPEPVYAEALTKWMTGKDKGLLMDVGGVKTQVKVYAVEREYACLKSTPRYRGPDRKGQKVGGNLTVGESFTGVYIATVGKTRWIVTPAGSWIRADALTPRVAVRPA